VLVYWCRIPTFLKLTGPFGVGGRLWGLLSAGALRGEERCVQFRDARAILDLRLGRSDFQSAGVNSQFKAWRLGNQGNN